MSGKKWWQVTPAVAKAAFFYVRLGKKRKKQIYKCGIHRSGSKLFMVKIFLVMDIVMHFSVNCNCTSSWISCWLPCLRSGGSFATSQNTENLSSSFSSACAQLSAKLLMWREIPGEGPGQWVPVSSSGIVLCISCVGQGSLLPHIPVLLCADSDYIWHEAENIHLLIL